MMMTAEAIDPRAGSDTMGRPRKGTLVKTRDGRWQALIRLPDGTRKRLPPGGFKKGTSEAFAREKASVWSEKARREGSVQVQPRRTEDRGSSWVEQWLAERRQRGIASVVGNEWHYRCYILPAIGEKHIRDWTADDLRKLCAELDGKVQREEITWKTAGIIWSTASKMCSDAVRSKVAALRCRDDNPAKDVAGPDRGVRVAKQYLFPSEVLTFVQCEAVSLQWRLLTVVAIYTYMRLGELRALRWEDVDLKHQVIHVHRSYDHTTQGDKSTKSKHARRIPIEPVLLPVLRWMRAQEPSAELVISMPTRRQIAQGFRTQLRRAGVTRAELHEATRTRKAMTFHDCRSTGITWAAIRGDEPLRIMQRAGHKSMSTTMGYIRTAEALRAGFGEPFPDLTACCWEPGLAHDIAHSAISARNQKALCGGASDGNGQFQTDSHSQRQSIVADGEANTAETGSACNSVCSLADADRSPRDVLIERLTETIKTATATGDLAAARVAHEALGKLLDEPKPGVAKVVDIRSQRSRKGGSRS
jgi:integrase